MHPDKTIPILGERVGCERECVGISIYAQHAAIRRRCFQKPSGIATQAQRAIDNRLPCLGYCRGENSF